MLSDNINFIIGLLHSLPYGTDSTVVSEYYSEVIRPLVSKIYSRKNIPLCMYYSGSLLELLESENGAFFNVVKELSDRKQIEILGGCFYESLLPFVPRPERISGIEKLTTFIRQEFGKRPRGCFIGHGIWSQEMVPVFSTAGMDYAFFPDSHLLHIGVKQSELFRPYITEHAGKTLKLIPYVTSLPDNTYSSKYEDFLSYFLNRAKSGNVLAVFDNTSDWAWLSLSEKKKRVGWWEGFIDFLGDKKNINLILPREFAKQQSDFVRVYFPELVLNQEGKSCAIHTGEYVSLREEARLLYSKMQYVNTLVNQIRRDRARKKAAKDDLLRGLSGYAYTNRVRGGIGDPVSRFSVFSALLDAEKNTREKGIFMPSIVKTDYDFDGRDEFLYQGYDINAYVSQKGGCVFELDYLPSSWNLLSTYSAKTGNGSITTQAFACDNVYESFVDDNIKDLKDVSGFAHALYDIKRYASDSDELVFNVSCVLKTKRKASVSVTKKYKFLKSGFCLSYELVSDSSKDVFFSPDFSFLLPPGYSWLGQINTGEENSELILNKNRVFTAESVCMYNVASKKKIRNLCIGFSYPVKVLYRVFKESVNDRQLTQAYCLSPVICLKPGETVEFSVTLSVGKGLPD